MVSLHLLPGTSVEFLLLVANVRGLSKLRQSAEFLFRGYLVSEEYKTIAEVRVYPRNPQITRPH